MKSAKKQSHASFWRQGEPYVWLCGASLAIILLVTATLLAVVLANGLSVFWPAELVSVTTKDGNVWLGQVTSHQEEGKDHGERFQLKIGNRDIHGFDFKWFDEADVTARRVPSDAVAVERMEYGNFYGYLISVTTPSGHSSNDVWTALDMARDTMLPLLESREKIASKIEKLNRKADQVRNQLLKAEYQGQSTNESSYVQKRATKEELDVRFRTLVEEQSKLDSTLTGFSLSLSNTQGRTVTLPIRDMVRIYQPNQMSLIKKCGHYISKTWELVSAEPREANTEGGLWPALFGTAMLVFIMSILSFPFGVIAGIYLREYAKEGWLVRAVRIAVNNLSGIPSIVYGVFGLGFFVYGIGGALDHLFFPERLPTPTFGTGGLLWASLTLGLLTIPVVIVSTEEAFGAIPRGVREASMALGATRFQTLYKVLLPMASPGIMTGFILAMARAAGEVAPLMITGVVKLAPTLPLDATPPFVHLDRKFMHLGFHIYDIGFQSPNVEAAKPMVYITTLLLVLLVLLMTSAAIALRTRMKKKFASGAF